MSHRPNEVVDVDVRADRFGAEPEPEPEPENQFRGNRHSLLVVRLCYKSDCPCLDCTEDNIRKWAWSGHHNLNGLYRETSYGLVSWPQDMGAVMTVHIDETISGCGGIKMIKDGETAAKEMH